MAALSLWLAPEESEREALAARSEGLAARLGTPPFAPHVTLLARVPGPLGAAQDRARALAARVRSLALTLTEVSHSAEFYRCLVLEAAPTAELLAARRAALDMMEATASEPYRPHLSLVYGTLPSAQREQAAADVRVALPLPLALRATALELYTTAGPPDTWTLAARFPLA
jgi:2'-5' RNA ligase